MNVGDAAVWVVVNSLPMAALLAGLVFYIPGMTWGWLLPEAPRSSRSGVGVVLTTAKCLLVGTALSLLVHFVQMQMGRVFPGGSFLAIGLVALAGMLMGLIQARARLIAHFIEAIPGLVAVIVLSVLVMELPDRGEWILGGWDPGIYVNQGVAASQNNGFNPGPDPMFSLLTDDELSSVTRQAYNFTEAYPVVPIDPHTRAFHPFFFPLTPTLISLLHQCGGLRAATRANEWMGCWTAILFLALVMNLVPARRSLAVFSTLALILQPIWLYHLHIPTSEMLQLFLLCGIGFLVAFRSTERDVSSLLATLLLLAEMNRFSFLPFGGLLILLLAWLDLQRENRRGLVGERLLQIAVLGIGAGIDWLLNPITIGRLGRPALLLVTGFGVLAISAVVVDIAGREPELRRMGSRLFNRWALPAAIAALAVVGAVSLLLDHRWIGPIRYNTLRLIPYVGLVAALMAAAGGGWLAIRRNPEWATIKTWCLFLLAATAISLFNPQIALLWPWATRRYLEFTVPLVAIGIGALLHAFWNSGGRAATTFRLLAVFLFSFLLYSTHRQSRAAWSATEFNGASSMLAAIANQVGVNDVVVADHFRWGTPLRFIYGKSVVNGELYYAGQGDPVKMKQALDALRQLRASGKRIRFLTSTERELGVYPIPVAPVSKDWTGAPLTYREVAHHPRGSTFPMKEKTKVFNLFTWK